jgi:type I restriction enzyme M protein
VILERLIQAEVGDIGDEELAKVQSGIVQELVELRRMIG